MLEFEDFLAFKFVEFLGFLDFSLKFKGSAEISLEFLGFNFLDFKFIEISPKFLEFFKLAFFKFADFKLEFLAKFPLIFLAYL